MNASALITYVYIIYTRIAIYIHTYCLYSQECFHCCHRQAVCLREAKCRELSIDKWQMHAPRAHNHSLVSDSRIGYQHN